jgi:hypothetical protein
MAYQTGTIDKLNDVLAVLRDFLLAQGWTANVNYREPILLNRVVDHRTSPPPPHDVYHWRWGRRLAMSKGTKFFSAQDFYLTADFNYGTNVGWANGPGISIVAGTSSANTMDEPTMTAQITAVQGAQADWYRHYTLASDGVTPVFGQNMQGPIQIPTFYNDVNQSSAVMVMPLPQVIYQENGTWSTGDFFWVNSPGPSSSTHPLNDTELYAPFGDSGTGFAKPMKYWLMSNPADDSWMMVILHDTVSLSLKTAYMGMGTIRKAGNWAGTGDYLCASKSNLNAFTGADVFTYSIEGHEINRFGPPGAIADDGGGHFAVFMPVVDSTGAGWRYIGTGARRILSTTEMDLIPGSVNPLGLKTGFGFSGLKSIKSSMVDAAVGLPAYLSIQRDSGLQSLIGSIPNVYQAKTFGFPFGYETVAPNGDPYVIFDGFMIKKVP